MARNSERSHSRAKHNVGTWSRPKDMTSAQDDAQTAWRRDYFRNARPDLDPQSTASKIMEFFGADTPYAQNAQSYDYRQKKWDDSVKSGNPDASWSLPGLDGFKFWGDEVDGRTPTQAEASAAFEDAYGRPATPSELAEFQDVLTDPRTRDEKNAATAIAALDLPLAGFGDEAVAGAMSSLGRGSYDDELALARAIENRDDAYGEVGPRMIAGGVGGLAATFGSPAIVLPFAAAQRAWQGGRTALGMAPQATNILGKAAQATGPGSAAGAADFGLWEFGRGEGGVDKRLQNVSGDDLATGAVLGGVIGPAMFGAGGAVKRGAVGGAKRLKEGVKRLSGNRTTEASARAPNDAPLRTKPRKPETKPVPNAPGDVRSDIEAAFVAQKRKARK